MLQLYYNRCPRKFVVSLAVVIVVVFLAVVAVATVVVVVFVADVRAVIAPATFTIIVVFAVCSCLDDPIVYHLLMFRLT